MTKKLMATSFLAGCMAVGWLGFQNAYAAKEPDLYFYPAQKWAIEDVSDKAPSQEKPVCTLTNTFNNGFKMQFAGSPSGFTNVNIDFIQPIFDKGKPYEVVYSVPGVTEITVSGKAFQESLLVSDLRGHSDFAASLREASVVDVQIRDNAFRFYLTGLGSALQDYGTCLHPQERLGAIDDEVETPSVPHTENINFSASAQRISADTSVIAQQDLIAPPPPENDSLASPPDTEKSVAASAPPPSADRQALTERLAQQLRENQVASTETGAAPVENPSSVRIKTEPQITKQTAHLEADFTKVGLPAQEEESPALSNEARNIAAATDTAIDTEQRGITSSPQDIEPSAPSAAEDFSDMRQKIQDLEEQVFKLTQENRMLDDELKAALKDAEQERLSVSSNNWDLERATMRYNESERQIERLGRQLQTQKAQCDQEKMKLEGMLFDPQVTNQQQLAKLSSLETALEEAKSKLVTQQRKYEERIRLLEEQLDTQ